MNKDLIEKYARILYNASAHDVPWSRLSAEAKRAVRVSAVALAEVVEKDAREDQRLVDADIILESVERVPDNTVMSIVVHDISTQVAETEVDISLLTA